MKHASDTFAQQTRRLASELQRRRDWAGGDPSRMGAVADALVELTAHRLAGHAWAEAAPGVQEEVTLSARVLAQHGPVGPYTPRADAVRSVTALVHLALIQSAAGLHAPAEQALAAAAGLREQLTRLDLDDALTPQTVAWALLVGARASLAAGDAGAANARADAAVALGADDGEFLAVDVARLASDARWAAGWAEPAVEHILRAVETYDALSAEALEAPARVPATMLERLGEPLFGLYSDAADRVLAVGAPGLGLTLRRRLVDLLGAVAVRRPEAQQLLPLALADLADDLRGIGRTAEADDVAELASSIAGEVDGTPPERRDRVRLGERMSWTALPPAETFGVAAREGSERSGRLAALRGPADAAENELRARNEAELAKRAADVAAESVRIADEAERRRARDERLAAERAERERREAADAAERERLERQRKRAERIAEHERQLERERAEAEVALRARVSHETDAERAEREELERLAAELAALDDTPPTDGETEQVEPEPAAPPPVESSPVELVKTPAAESAPSPVEPAETPAVESAPPLVEPVETPVESVPSPVEPVETSAGSEPSPVEPVETPAVESAPSPVEPVETPAAESEPVDADALERARTDVEEAAATGKRRDVREASETLVDELRARFEDSPEEYLDEYLAALDQLATARWQAGDWWGSRGPAKQAKALRKAHGH